MGKKVFTILRSKLLFICLNLCKCFKKLMGKTMFKLNCHFFFFLSGPMQNLYYECLLWLEYIALHFEMYVLIFYNISQYFTITALKKRMGNLKKKVYLTQNSCFGYSKEPSQWDGSFEHKKCMLKLLGKKIFTILRSNFAFILIYAVLLWLDHCLVLVQHKKTCPDMTEKLLTGM